MIQYNYKSIYKMLKVNNSHQDAEDKNVRETCIYEWFLFDYFLHRGNSLHVYKIRIYFSRDFISCLGVSYD